MRLRYARLGALVGTTALAAGLVVAVPSSADAVTAGTVIARTATLTKPTGTVPAGAAALTSVAIRQDLQRRTMTVTARWGAGTAPYGVGVALGVRDGQKCVPNPDGNEATVLLYPGKRTSEMWFGSPDSAAAGRYTSATRSGTAVVKDARLARQTWSCVFAANLTPEFRELQAFAPAGLAAVKAAPKVSVAVSPKKRVVRSGKWVKVKVVVRNTGTATQRGVKVRAKGTKRVRIKGTKVRSYGSVVEGTKETKVFKVRVTKKGKHKVTFRVRSGAKTVKKTVTLVRR